MTTTTTTPLAALTTALRESLGRGVRIDGQLHEALLEAEKALTVSPLVEAFHVLFDIKDDAPVISFGVDNVRYAAYEAVGAVEKVMRLLDVEPPRRFDGQGR